MAQLVEVRGSSANFKNNICLPIVNCIENTKKEKEAGNGPLKNFCIALKRILT